MPDEPAEVAFTPMDHWGETQHALKLAKVGVTFEIINECPEGWGAPCIGYFSEPGTRGQGQFWRTPGGMIFVRMADDRTFYVRNIGRLAAFLIRRNTLPGTDHGPDSGGARFAKRTAKSPQAQHAAA